MAELGVLANLVAVVGAGLQLSVGLYDFASTLGSAGREIEDMGYDITLLCAVLKRVQSTLDNPKSTRLSATAIQTTQDIVRRCQRILDDIKGILSKLRKDGQNHLDILARVKWTFKRSKILMLRGSLQSCTTTLHLMLSAIDWARNTTRRSRNGEPDPDHDQDREMTHSLFLAQQSANHRLEELEDQAVDELPSAEDYTASTNASKLHPGLHSASDVASHHRRNRFPTSTDATFSDTSQTRLSLETKRTSVLLNDCLYESKPIFGSVRRKTLWPLNRSQSLLLSDDLLRRWIEGIDVPPSHQNHLHLQPSKDQVLSEPNQEPHVSTGAGLDSGTNSQIHKRDGPDQATTVPDQETSTSTKSSVPFLSSNGPVDEPTRGELPLSSTPDDVKSKFSQVTVDYPCYKVLPALVQKHSATLSIRGKPLDWRQYALYIVWGDQERTLGLEEKPLPLFRNLEKEGKRPTFVLRYIGPSEPESHPRHHTDAVDFEKKLQPCDPILQALSTQTVANLGAHDHSSSTVSESRSVQRLPRWL